MESLTLGPEERNPDHVRLIKELDDGTAKIVKGIKKNENAYWSPQVWQARKDLSAARKAVRTAKSVRECFAAFAEGFRNAITRLELSKKDFHAPKLEKKRECIAALLKKIPEKYRGGKAPA